MDKYRKGNRCKYLLNFHIILVCKYRHKLFLINEVEPEIIKLIIEISSKWNVSVDVVNTDIDHIHIVISTTPVFNISNYIRLIKSYTTFHIWEVFEKELKSYFWKERTFWSDGYFITTVGNASIETIQKYIENQG